MTLMALMMGSGRETQNFRLPLDFQLFHSQNNNLMINCPIVSSRKLKVKIRE